MDRHESEDVLSALLDGELTKAEAIGAAEHLAVCEGCRRTFAGLKSARQFVKAAPHRSMPAGLAAELQRRVDAPPEPWFRPVLRPFHRYAVPAFGFAAASFFVCLWVWEKRLAPATEIPIEQLMAAHERYGDEGLLGGLDPAQAGFTASLASEMKEDDELEGEEL